jgi:ATP-binding cassette subfamily F protein 3
LADARLLVMRPDVLLLDEPTNHLDFESLAWFEGFIEAYEGAVIAVSHDRYFLNRVPTHIAELTKKGIVEYPGGYDEFLEGRAIRRDQQEAKKAGVDRQRAHLQSFVDRFKAKASKAKQAQSRMKMLAKLEHVEVDDTTGGIGFRFAEPGRTGKEVLSAHHVQKSYGDNVVYTDLNLTMWRGDRIALVGVNGAGKSTLLKVLAGMTEIQGGEVRIGAGVKIDYYAQHQLDVLDAGSTVYEEARRAAGDSTVPMVRKVLGGFGFSGHMVDKRVGVLSGGERARVALARMVLRAPNVLLLDEPTNHLDLTSREVLEDALSNFAGTVVIVSHDRYFINAVATKILEVQPGGLVTPYLGDYDAYLYRKAGGDPDVIEQLLRGDVPDREDKAGEGTAATREQEKQRKREEAEKRNELGRKVKPLRDRLEQLEKEIARHEARLQAILQAQMDPALYEDGAKVQALSIEQADLRKAVEEAMGKWEELALRIEGVEGQG